MEIIPFLRLSGRRIVLLLIFAGAAATAGGAYARDLPVTNTGSTTVFLERVYPGDRYDREAFVANYQSAAESLSLVHEAVAQQLGIEAEAVAEGVTVTVPDKADIVYVRFESTDPDLALRASNTAASETLRALIRAELASATASNDRAVLMSERAEGELRATLAPFGTTDLTAAYANIDAQVMALETDLAKTKGDEPTRANLEALLTFRRQQRAAMAAALPDYERFLVRLDNAEVAAQRAQLTLDTVSERMAVAQNDEALVSTGVRSNSPTVLIARYAAAAGIAATAVVLGLFFVIEAVRSGAARRRGGTGAPVWVANERRVDPPTPLRPNPSVPASVPPGVPTRRLG